MQDKKSKAGNLLPMNFTNGSGKEIRAIINNEGTPMFIAKDVFKTLGIHWAGKRTLKIIPDEWKGVVSYTTHRGKQQLITINEAAMYKIAFRSDKPEADKFTNWVASEVLPAIRKTGGFRGGEKLAPIPKRQLKGVKKVSVNNRSMYPYRSFLIALNSSPGGTAYKKVKAYPNHFVDFNKTIYVSEEMAHLIYANKLVYIRRKEIKEMTPILPLNFDNPTKLQGGQA